MTHTSYQPHLRSLGALLLLVGVAALASGCGGGDKPDKPESGGSSPRATTASSSGSSTTGGGAAFDKIKFKSDGETVAFSIKKKDDGYKIVDGAEKELLRLKTKGDKIKFKDANDKELGHVTTSSSTKFKLKDAAQEVTYFAFQQQDDGDWKLEDGNGELIYKIKKRDYGWEVKDAAEAELYKIKVKDDKTSIRDADDKTKFYTKDPVKSVAVVPLGLDKLSREQQWALMCKLLQ